MQSTLFFMPLKIRDGEDGMLLNPLALSDLAASTLFLGCSLYGAGFREGVLPDSLPPASLSQLHMHHPTLEVYHGSNLKVVDKRVRLAELVLCKAALSVYNRRKKRLVEVIHDGKIVLSMRAIYQSKFGLGLKDTGAKEILQNISESQGKKMDTLDSAKDIPKFVELFKYPSHSGIAGSMNALVLIRPSTGVNLCANPVKEQTQIVIQQMQKGLYIAWLVVRCFKYLSIVVKHLKYLLL
nr:phosphatidylserine decarboxylase proenzyme 2-like [Ipomoea batatas]GMD85599.1 phosphatidylserine decarboxylase proenzyme 2-like [Ipomoea batatas]